LRLNPSLLKFSNFERLPGRNLQTVMTKYCARVWGSHRLRTAGSSKGTILPLPDRLQPRSTAKSRPNLSGKSRSQRDTKHETPVVAGPFPPAAKLG